MFGMRFGSTYLQEMTKLWNFSQNQRFSLIPKKRVGSEVLSMATSSADVGWRDGKPRSDLNAMLQELGIEGLIFGLTGNPRMREIFELMNLE